jgi:hypothetical protein
MDLGGRRLKLDSLWVNVLKPGGSHSGHIHPHSVVSGTVYIAVPPGAGSLKLEDPRLPMLMAAPPRRADAPEELRTFVYAEPEPAASSCGRAGCVTRSFPAQAAANASASASITESRSDMGFRCGIVGLPNVGKSTLFNALTETAAAQAANYPFCTIEPNVGRVAVPDPRLAEIARSPSRPM